jgi:hypothetical protein
MVIGITAAVCYQALLITPNNKAIIAITNNTWIIFPPNGVTNAPKIQIITRITAIFK